jgi:hypothetical protein
MINLQLDEKTLEPVVRKALKNILRELLDEKEEPVKEKKAATQPLDKPAADIAKILEKWGQYHDTLIEQYGSLSRRNR